MYCIPIIGKSIGAKGGGIGGALVGAAEFCD